MSRRVPSRVTGYPWIYAKAPGVPARTAARGKWIVLTGAADTDRWWAVISAAVEAGHLGDLAKAATAWPSSRQPDPRVKVICVYTPDWRDHDDVRRVLRALRGLGVRWRLTYKTDEATAGGRYGPGSCVYVSPAGSGDFGPAGPDTEP